ncbi:GNAT family N-acetyltransferase [Nereida sp. MMG025]|uniref:GNAT family N-acetyltransferase n=1 Tax=Nereida sp. MMG025 TaxID=2909981 RepID=UPI001F186FA8|nr:GNAT family N-acetyltransferase [Nereida sp. MMG025]MCF6444903.1 GNAT family N-acetyltransferase [Nereida sp. MMG025]
MIIIERGDPRHPAATALLKQSHALMESLFPPEDNAYLDIEELCAPHIHFFIARRGEVIRGTGALADKGSYGEVKSMFVDPEARGQGIADAILRALEDEARGMGKAKLMLETGNTLHAAHKLYERHGFEYRAPFGDYVANSSSWFMEKVL